MEEHEAGGNMPTAAETTCRVCMRLEAFKAAGALACSPGSMYQDQDLTCLF